GLARRASAKGIRVHCDAVQAAGKIPIDFEGLGVDYLVISAHKLGGPKGVGALVVRRGAPFEPLFRGSAHERGRRGGTENLPGIVGLGEAAEHAARELARENPRLLELRGRLERGIRAALPDVVYHGETSPRLPNTLNLSVPGARSDHLLMALDARGVAASAGAACASGAAALLAEQGHDVTGVTLKLWCYGRSPLSPRACCTLEAIDDARVVARRMGFPHFVIEAEEVFRARVLQPFLDAYASGRTPYPCALCNQSLKFGDLVSRME